MQRLVISGALVAMAISMTGCSGGADNTAPAAAGTAFYRAIQMNQFDQACDLLAEQTRKKLGEPEKTDCPQALGSIGLSASHVASVQTYGRKAMVQLDGDVAFLAQENNKWHITAAGCKEQPDNPYDCEVEAN